VCRYVKKFADSNSVACDYANSKSGHWVPLLAILCDGNNFEYFVYDSVDKLVYTSGRVTGIISDDQESQSVFLLSVEKNKLFPDHKMIHIFITIPQPPSIFSIGLLWPISTGSEHSVISLSTGPKRKNDHL
jgi:hypothetical protein